MSKSEEEPKSNIEEIEDALDDYLSKSAEILESKQEILQDTKTKQPSLSVSELQIHSLILKVN